MDLKSLETKELHELVKSIYEELSSRRTDEIDSWNWACFKAELRKISTAQQVDSLANWDRMTKQRKKQFKDAWTQAETDFIAIGLPAGQRMSVMIINLICKSNYIDPYKILFTDICNGLTHIIDIFDTIMPNYRGNKPYMDMLQEALLYGQSS